MNHVIFECKGYHLNELQIHFFITFIIQKNVVSKCTHYCDNFSMET
jgi:hypothetical protein